MPEEAIVLAGGLGTRLRSVVNNVPKPMALVCNRPFLVYIFEYLLKQDIKHIILSVGYKFEIIKNFFGNQYKNIKITYAIENQPLGTGGAIKNSLIKTNQKEVFILNGDTFFNINLKDFYNFHKNKKSNLTIVLKKINQTDRYGIIEIDQNNKIVSFLEKVKRKNVLINGGIYLINKDFFLTLASENKFSFEKDFIEKYYQKYDFYGLPFNEYFIDIGIPQDYARANKEFKKIEY